MVGYKFESWEKQDSLYACLPVWFLHATSVHTIILWNIELYRNEHVSLYTISDAIISVWVSVHILPSIVERWTGGTERETVST